MRAWEFITESEFDSWHQAAMPGMQSLPTTDQYYDIYRFGVSMAGAGGTDEVTATAKGPVRDHPTVMGYSSVDDDIINKALAVTGKSARKITTSKSEEPDDTYKQSPMTPKGPVKRKS